MEPEKILQGLGLSDKEAKVYLALLKAGTSSAYGVAVRSGLKRPTAYVILDALVSKGVAYLIPKTKKKVYRANSPEKLLELSEEKIRMMRESLPKIQALAREGVQKPQVLYFEGVGGIDEASSYKIKEMAGKEMLGFFAKATNDTLKQFDNFTEYNAKLKKLNIKERGIAPNDPTITSFRKLDKEYGREIRTLSQEKYSSTVSIEIGQDCVKFYDFENLQGLVIDNPSIAKTLAEVFELVWENLK